MLFIETLLNDWKNVVESAVLSYNNFWKNTKFEIYIYKYQPLFFYQNYLNKNWLRDQWFWRFFNSFRIATVWTMSIIKSDQDLFKGRLYSLSGKIRRSSEWEHIKICCSFCHYEKYRHFTLISMQKVSFYIVDEVQKQDFHTLKSLKLSHYSLINYVIFSHHCIGFINHVRGDNYALKLLKVCKKMSYLSHVYVDDSSVSKWCSSRDQEVNGSSPGYLRLAYDSSRQWDLLISTRTRTFYFIVTLYISFFIVNYNDFVLMIVFINFIVDNLTKPMLNWFLFIIMLRVPTDDLDTHLYFYVSNNIWWHECAECVWVNTVPFELEYIIYFLTA